VGHRRRYQRGDHPGQHLLGVTGEHLRRQFCGRIFQLKLKSSRISTV
jgi:hypothetical protein